LKEEHVCIYSLDDCRCRICEKLYCAEHYCAVACPNPSERSEKDQLKRFEEGCKDDE